MGFQLQGMRWPEQQERVDVTAWVGCRGRPAPAALPRTLDLDILVLKGGQALTSGHYCFLLLPFLHVTCTPRPCRVPLQVSLASPVERDELQTL